jgi:ribosomal protein S18 acetylase RimI-like enzyme
MKRFVEFLREGKDDIGPPSEEHISKFSKELKNKHGLEHVWLHHDKNTGHLHLDSIIVKKGDQGQGRGSRAMNDITSFADKHKLPMSLETAVANKNWGTTSSGRLKKFYKGFGFHKNDGRHYNPAVSGNMIRPVKK